MTNRKKILDHSLIQAKIRRLAHQIFEHSVNEEIIHLYSIAENGFLIGQEISMLLESSAYLKKLNHYKVALEKKSGKSSISIEEAKTYSTNNSKMFFVIDDVTDSGKTMFQVCSYLHTFGPEQIKTVSLIDRNHRKYPVQVDIAGQLISTTLNEKVTVEKSGNEWSAYLE